MFLMDSCLEPDGKLSGFFAATSPGKLQPQKCCGTGPPGVWALELAPSMIPTLTSGTLYSRHINSLTLGPESRAVDRGVGDCHSGSLAELKPETELFHKKYVEQEASQHWVQGIGKISSYFWPSITDSLLFRSACGRSMVPLQHGNRSLRCYQLLRSPPIGLSTGWPTTPTTLPNSIGPS